MSSTYYAQPYNISATGFFFDTYDEYQEKAATLQDRYGNPVEEFEIQYIDGDDGELFRACDVTQGSLEQWFEDVENLDDNKKAALYFLCDDIGDSIATALEKIEDVYLSECTLLEAVTALFNEYYLSEVPQDVRCYIDYEAYARDIKLNSGMAEFEFNGSTYTCTNAAHL